MQSELNKKKKATWRNNPAGKRIKPIVGLLPVITKASSIIEAIDSYQVAKIILTNNKVAYLSIPKTTTKNDVKIIEHQVKQLLLQIKLNSECKVN